MAKIKQRFGISKDAMLGIAMSFAVGLITSIILTLIVLLISN